MCSQRKEDITDITKKAWSDNWKDHSIEEVLRIFEYTRVQRLLGTFREVLPKEGRILEGGCGLGPWVIKLRSLGFDIAGLDYDPISINKIRAFDESIPLYVSNIEKMPFDEDYFSAYMSLGVLEHFCEGPQKAIGEAWRVLKPGGLFIVMLPYLNFLLRLKIPFINLKKNNMVRKLLGKGEKNFYYECYFGIKEITKLLKEGGFSIESIRPADHIFSFVTFSSIFRDRNSYDGENALAVKCADFFEKIFPWQTAGSSFIVAKKKA